MLMISAKTRNFVLVYATIYNFIEAVSANCLSENPRIMDADFNPYNNPIDVWKVQNKDMKDLVRLFSTRFNRAHSSGGMDADDMEQIATIFRDFKYSTNTEIQIFFRFWVSTKKNGTGKDLKHAYETLSNFSVNYPDIVAGLYVQTSFDTYAEDFEVMTEAFGPLEDAKIPLGFQVDDCKSDFQQSTGEILRKMQKLSFYACDLEIHHLPTPEAQADQILKSCNDLRSSARKVNIKANIMCTVSYGSHGLMPNKISGSLEGFNRFWCRIIDALKNNPEQTPIIFQSAFDDTPARFKEKLSAEACDSAYHTGWWKRTSKHSNSAEAFSEKVEFLKPDIPKDCSFTGFIIGVSVMGVINVFSIFILGCICCKKSNISMFSRTLLNKEDIRLFVKGSQGLKSDTDNEGQQVPYDKTFEIQKSSFEINLFRQLGQGEHGLIYKGKLVESETEVAVKTSRHSTSSIKQLLSEIKILIHVGKHENVLSLIAANTSEMQKGLVYIILEFCEFGSLQDVLRNTERLCSVDAVISDNKNGSDFVILADRWAKEIAAGMLHISSKKIIHADLAARNVLVDSNGVAKITDFGLSRKLYTYSQYVKKHQEPLPWRWMAPESIKSMIFSTESDVWAYGITLFEIYSKGKLPYPGMAWDFSFIELIESGMINNQPEFADTTRFDVMKSCWNMSPKHRPSFRQIHDLFSKNLQRGSYLCVAE